MGKLIDSIRKEKKEREEQEKKRQAASLTPKLPSYSSVLAKQNDKFGFSQARQQKSFDVQPTEKLGLLDQIKREKTAAQANGIVDRLNTWYKNNNNFMSNYQARFSGLSGTYDDPYDAGISDWYSAVAEQKSRFDAEANSIMSYLSANRDLFDEEWLNATVTNLDYARKQQDSVLKATEGYSQYWSQWDSEDAYKRYQKIASIADMTSEQIKKYLGKDDPVAYIDDNGKEVTWDSLYKSKYYKEFTGKEDFADKSKLGWNSYLADQEKKEQAAAKTQKEEKWYEKIARWYGNAGYSDTSLPLGNVPQITDDLRNDTSHAYPSDNWTDEQKGIYGYLYSTDRTEAYNYASYANEANNKAENEKKITAIENWATDNGFNGSVATLASIALMPFSLTDTLSALTEYNATGTVSTPATPMPGQISGAITSAISETLNQKYGTLNENKHVIGGKGWGDVYQLGTSIANSMLTAYTQGGLGTYMVFFGSASASGMYEAKERGATDAQAVTLGILNGLAEAAGEAFSVDKLLGLAGVDELKSFFGNVLLQAGIEASEEGFTTLLNNLADQIVMGDKSNFNVLVNYYMTKKKLSEEEAKRKAWADMANDLAYDVLGGFVSGGVSGGLQTGIQTGVQGLYDTAKGKEYKKNYGADIGGALAAEAVAISPDSKFAQRMQAKVEGGRELSNRRVGKLVRQNEAAMRENDIATMKKAAEDKLTARGERGDVKKLAEIIVKSEIGEKLTRAETNALEASDFGQSVRQEMARASLKSDQEMDRWAENLGTDRINADVYGRMVAEMENEGADPSFVRLTNEQRSADRFADIAKKNGNVIEESSANGSKMEQVDNTASNVQISSKDARITASESTADTQQVTGKLQASKTEFATDTNVGDKVAQEPAVASEGLTETREGKGATYETPGVKDAQTGEIKAPEGSKATVKVDGKDVGVKVKEIASVSNGAITVRLDNGETVNANEIDFESGDVALVYQAAADMSTRVGGFNADTVRVFVNGFNPDAGLTAGEYVNGFREAYRYGAEGAPISELAKGEYTKRMTEEMRNRAFHFGRAFGNEKVERAQAALDAKKSESPKKRSESAKIDSKTTKEGEGAMTDNDNTSYYDGDRNTLSERQRASIEFLEKTFGNKGVKFVFFESYTDESGNRVYKNSEGKVLPAPNGYYKASDGSIWIDINAGQDGEGTILITASHELTHFIKDWSPKKFSTFAEFLYEQYGKNDIPLEAYVRDKIRKAAKNGRTISREGAYEEFVADSCEMMLVDILNNKNEKNLQKLLTKDKSLFEKIKEFFADLFKRIKAAYEGVNPQSREGAYVREMHDVADKLQTMWTEALLDATDTHKAIGENVAEKGGEAKLSDSDYDISYSERYENFDKPIALQDIAVLRSIGSKSINDFTSDDTEKAQKWAYKFYQELGVKSPFFRAWFGDWRAKDKGQIKIVSVPTIDISQVSLVNGNYVVKDTGWNVYAGKTLNDDTRHHSGGNRINVKALNAIEAILDNAVLLDTIVSAKDTKKKSDNTAFLHKLYTIIQYNGRKYIAKTTVEEYYNETINDISRRAYNLKAIKIEPVGGQLGENSSSSIPDTSSMISISDLYEIVKSFDKDFSPALEVNEKMLSEDGTPKIFYHGTKAAFTAFDRKKAKSSGLYGRGFYFTDSKSHSAAYGDTMAVYLNIRKPLSPDSDTVTKSQIRNFLSAVAENEDYSIENYGTYDVDEVLSGITSRDAFAVIQDINATAIGDFVEAVELFNSVNGTQYDGIVVPTETVAFRPEQIKSATDNNGTFDGENADIRYSFRDTASGMANDSLRPYNEELAGFIKNNGNYIIDSFEKLEQIVDLAFNDPMHKATAYFGIINTETLEKIKDSIPNLPKTSKDILFKTGRDYSIATTFDSIRHIVDGKALTRADVVNYLDRLADTIVEFDSVAFNFYDKGNEKIPGLLFKKKFTDGTIVSFDLISHKKRSMVLQTLYMDSANYQKKKAAETLLMHKANSNTSETQVGQPSVRSAETLPVHKASAHTPKAGVGQTSDNSISHLDENVKAQEEKYSDRDDFYETRRELKEKYGVDTEAVLTMADGYLRNYGGVLGKTQFRKQFLDLTLEAVKFMSDTSGESIGRVNDMVIETATEIVNNPAISGELVDELRKIKKHIKDTRIKIPSGGKGDFDIVGGFEAFRRKHIGRLTLTNDGIDVDAIYPEFQELFGKSWFPDNIDNVPDQLMRIAEVADASLGDYSENYYNSEEVVMDVAGEIFDKVQTIALNASENAARINYRRAEDNLSPRGLLANALEGVAQNDIERDKLKNYREKIGKLNAEEQKLQNLRREIKELSFATGPRDTARIERLRAEATKTANRISIYDKQLLELEASGPLRDVLARERQKAYKRAEAEGREALAKYRERAAKTQEELKRRYQESKKRGTENRRKTEIRHKIKRTVGELNDMLLHGSKNRNVKSGLQEAVAAALEAINMDTVAADERVAKYNELIAKATDPDVIESLTKTRDNIRKQGDALGDKLEAMRKAYRDIREKDGNSEYPDYFKAEAQLIENRIESVIDKVGNTPLRNMTYAQLDAVYDMYKMVLATVRNANAVFKDGKAEDLQKNVGAVMTELSAIPKLPEERSAVGDNLRGYVWNELTPYYAFSRIGSETFESFYWEAIKGQDVYARDIDEARDVASEAREKYHYDAWDFDKIHKFKLADGREFSVSLKHMMSIYAYAKRPQAAEHMRKGGFFFNDKETFRKKGGVLTMIRDSEASFKIDDESLAAIISAMTEEQRRYVDDMQTYLTQMGEKGNEVTRVLWGIDLFKEKVYFPLKSSRDFIYQANQPVQESSLKNDGMTKETKPGASNPIILEAFDEVWAAHVNRMSQYHAYVLPIENLNKVLNYGTWANTDAVAVSTMLRSRYGSAVNDYLNQFIGDLNGVRNSQGATAAFFSGMFTKFKKTAVAGSLSVVIQQPTAILRAQSLIDGKYFAHLPVAEKLSERWDEVKKYAPIAIIKDMGGFDAGAGRQTTEWLNADTQRGLKKVSSKIDDITMWGAAMGDQIGWCAIWEAVKRETLAKNPKLVPTSEEFMKLVGERFTEVVVKTQVYDSTLSRSGYMRSKNALVKMMTSFMGEPTVSANMFYDSVLQAKRGSISKRTAARTIGAVYLATTAAALAKSLIYALRDDDDDESYAEKYLQALGGAILGDINPLTWLPGVRDVLSIFDGWEVERTDMALFQDLKNAIDGLDSENKSVWRKIEDFAGAVASFFGLPLKNVMRTAREVYNGFENLLDGISGGKLGKAFLEGVTGKETGRSEALYDAIMAGDAARLEVYRGDYKTEDAYNSALSKALRENDERIAAAAEARYNGDIAEYMRIAKEIISEGNFSQDNVVAAINAKMAALKKAEETGTEEQTEEDKVESIYKVDDFFKAVRGGDIATAYAVREDLVNIAIENGEDREDAEKAFESKLVTYVSEQYKEALIGDSDAKSMLTRYGGMTEAKADSRVRYWAFKLENPEYEDLYEGAVNKYYEGYYKDGELYGKSAQSYGITLDVYAEYVRETSGLSKKEDIMYIINTLPLSKEQKDALYYLNGWAESTIREAPWR